MAQFRQRLLSAAEAAAQLQVSRRWFYTLFSDYLRAVAGRRTQCWQPGRSGGNRRAAWPTGAAALVRKLLRADPPASYSFAASEVHRRYDHPLDRATVRRWAIRQRLEVARRPPPRPGSPRRWQLQQIGALWQYDASPHRWLPGDAGVCSLLELIDDCSRVLPGAQLYPRETLLAHLEFLPAVFQEVGLPLCLYVDDHRFFFTHTPEALTQLAAALKFYEVSLRYAPTPQAKGKIERAHQFWQKRLPSLLAAEEVHALARANELLDQLRRHHNRHERHRELGMTPQAAWEAARRAKRSALRAPPRCPWWPYVWSLRTVVKVGSDGRISVGPQRVILRRPVGTRVVRCQHPNGDITVLAEPPAHGKRPEVLFHWPASP